MPNCAYCGIHIKGLYEQDGIEIEHYCSDYCKRAYNNLDADPFEKYRLNEVEL